MHIKGSQKEQLQGGTTDLEVEGVNWRSLNEIYKPLWVALAVWPSVGAGVEETLDFFCQSLLTPQK